MRNWASVFFLLAFFTPFLPAQNNWLSGKKIGIYLSKKQFNFNENYNTPLTQLLQAGGKEAKNIEDLKSEVLVILGEEIEKQCKQNLGLDSAWFVNANPEAARKVVSQLSGTLAKLDLHQPEFSGTDFIVIVGEIELGHYKTSAIYSRSNRILTEQILNRSGRVSIKVFKTQDGSLFYEGSSCLTENDLPKRERLFSFYNESSAVGDFLGTLFSGVFSPLFGKEEFPCSQN